MFSQDQSQLPFVEMMDLTEAAHVGQFWLHGHLKLYGQGLHGYLPRSRNTRSAFQKDQPFTSEYGSGILGGNSDYPIGIAINLTSHLFSPQVPKIA